jgi:hypothetical protein
MKKELAAITKFYNGKTAKRSGVPLINHIHEGIIVLGEIHAWHRAYAGWCLHPLVQNDEVLLSNMKMLMSLDTSPRNMVLAMEYRAVANAWLSNKVQMFEGELIMIDGPRLSPIKCVNDMLRADKVQNRKDFEKYHKGTHPRSAELELYFKKWLDALDVTEEQYQYLCTKIDDMHAKIPVQPTGPAQKFLPLIFKG